MTLDETSLTEALNSIDADVAPDLTARVRAGGRRRLVRRRSLAAVGAVAVGAAAAPATLAVRSAVGSGNGSGSLQLGTSPTTATVTDLYAAPPPAGSQCNSGFGTKVPPSAHPDLLLLPPSDQQVRYAFVRNQTSQCVYPHVALTALQMHGDSVAAGVLVEGPNAPTATEDGRQGPDVDFLGDTGHRPIGGQPASEFTIAQRTDAYWTEPDGGQWHALVRDMSQDDAVALLNRLAIDGHDGTATLPGAAGEGWTVEAPAKDRSADDIGWVAAQWRDRQGHLVDLTMTQTPDRTFQGAVDGAGGASIVTVRGEPALLTPTGGNGGDAYSLVWQEAEDVQVALAVTGGSAAEIQQIAQSLVLASPDDPRFALQGG